MENTTLEGVTALVAQYNEKLLPYGVECTLHRRYITSKVIPYEGHRLIDKVVYSFRKKREQTEFHNAPNRFKAVEITVKPLQKGVVSTTDCKKYIFVVETIGRDNLGKPPKHIIRKEKKVLGEVEGRLRKLLKRAEREHDATWCKSNRLDKIRYVLSAKYV